MSEEGRWMIGSEWIDWKDLQPGHKVVGWRSQKTGNPTILCEVDEPIIVTEIDEERNEVSPDLGYLTGFDWRVMATFTHPDKDPGPDEEDHEIADIDMIKPGDMYIGYRDRSGPCYWGLNRYLVTKIWTSKHGNRVMEIVDPTTKRVICQDYRLGGGSATYFIRRGKNANNGFKDAKLDLSSLKKADPGDRFPHRCTGCGGRAYIGLFSVEHEDPKVTCQAK